MQYRFIANGLKNELDQLKQQDTKWQMLKEFIKNRPNYAGYDIQQHGMKVIADILDKMQELEEKDVKY